MTPHLTGRGVVALVSGLALFVAGTFGRAVPLCLGGEALLGLVLFEFLRSAHLGREVAAGAVVLQWTPSTELILGVPMSTCVRVSNRSTTTITRCLVALRTSRGLEVEPVTRVGGRVRGGATAETVAEITGVRAGRAAVHGAWVDLETGFGWGRVSVYMPMQEVVFVRVPAGGGGRIASWVKARPARPAAGVHAAATRGAGVELRELREFSPGDTLRRVDWKATARRQRVTVRALEDDISFGVAVVFDASSTMRSASGRKLAFAQSVVAALAAAAVGRGERLGGVIVDSGVLCTLPPRPGARRALRFVELVSRVEEMVDASLTDVGEQEVMEAVIHYVVLHGGPDFRVRRVAESASVARFAPMGETFDVAGLERWIEATAGDEIRALDAELRELGMATGHESLARRFARLRCVGLPYRAESWLSRKALGLAEAIDAMERQVRGEGAVVVLTDLCGVQDVGALAGAGARARSRGTPLVLGCVRTTAFLDAPDDETDARVHELLCAQEERRQEGVVARLRASGVSVVEIGSGAAGAAACGLVAALAPGGSGAAARARGVQAS